MRGRELDTCPAEVDSRLGVVDPRCVIDGDVGRGDAELGNGILNIIIRNRGEI